MRSRRRVEFALLGVLLVALVLVVRRNLAAPAAPPPASPGTTARAAARPARPAVARKGATPAEVEAVRLDVLDERRPAPSDPGRDLFQMGPSRASSPAMAAGPVRPGPPIPMTQPVAAAVTPAIALKFVGIVHPANQAQIAVLSDGTNVFYGREGETIDGRYRIERIGVESIEMVWVDGHGRQVIRLSGS